ncbi:MAG: hypothetical protein AAGA56_11765 [Myxococcota bacterium]
MSAPRFRSSRRRLASATAAAVAIDYAAVTPPASGIRRTAIERTIHLTGDWAETRDVRRNVADWLEGAEADLVRGAQMVASELAENALEHGAGEATLALRRNQEQVVVRVVSGPHDDAEIDALAERIRAIETCSDLEGLFQRRLRELFRRDVARAQLGLLRIKLEGGFSLALERCNGRRVAVVASRRLEKD